MFSKLSKGVKQQFKFYTFLQVRNCRFRVYPKSTQTTNTENTRKGERKMRVAYVRVSTVEQNEERQLQALEGFEIEKWFVEKKSGKNTNREQLTLMLEFVRAGDVIYVMDFSRLSRSVSDLLNIVQTLERKNVRLVSLKENIDTHTPTGKLMLTVIGAIAEFERENLLERQKEGIDIAKKQGRYKGKKRKTLENFDQVYNEWKNNNITATSASKLLGVTRATFYNRVKQKEMETEKKDL